MMQIECPERYADHVLAREKFGSFAELVAQCFQDVGVSNRLPCISTNLRFLSEISKNYQHTSRTKALAIEKQFMRFFGDYSQTPIGIGEVSGKHVYMKKEEMTPFLSYIIIFFLMNPLSQNKRDDIIVQLGTRLGKAKVDITIEDILENKKYIHDQIDFAVGAKSSFSYANWSKISSELLPAIHEGRRESATRQGRSKSRSRNRQRSRGRTPYRRSFNAQTPEEMTNWINSINMIFALDLMSNSPRISPL